MKRNILFLTAALAATGSLLAAPKDDVTSAIKKLADASSYSWSTTTTNLAAGGGGGGRGGRGGGPLAGKASKDGFALVTSTGGQGDTLVALKGDKVVLKTPDGGTWQTIEEVTAGGGRGGARFRTLKVPTAEALELLGAVADLKAADGAFSGDLTKAVVVTRLTVGGRGGGDAPPPPTDAKGTVKFWVKDGALAKYEFNVQGKTTNFQGDPQDVNRTTTVEIKEVGTAKVEVPEDAKKKLQ